MERKLEEAKRQIRQNILKNIDYSKDISDEEMYELVDNELSRQLRHMVISFEDRKKLRLQIFHSIRKLDILQELIDDPGITEIMINGTDNIFIEKDGAISRFEGRFESEEKLEDVVQQIVASCNRVVNQSQPIVDARLSNGSRVNIVLEPISLTGPIITIRRFPDKPITMERLIELGSISAELSNFLEALIKAGYNIFISGGTGSGKTTLLNALTNYIPKDLRVLTVEDSAELQVQGVSNLVRLESRNANVEGCRPISIRDLIKASLRMRPDWVVVGEVRGGECVDMLQAMNTGHRAMSTGHANSARDMLYRLETMSLMGMGELPLSAVRGQISSGIDIIVHLGRLRDKSRKVMEICEVEKELDKSGKIQLRTLYVFEEHKNLENGKIKGSWRKMSELKNTEKLVAAGIELSPDKK
nr:ATPase, T2SS/T4P/T4SS family [uncultured Butyrivibrio sp.]